MDIPVAKIENRRDLCKRVTGLVALFGVMSASIFAQEIGYSGVSPVNNSFGGVAVAAPIDGTAAIYWNPATLHGFDKAEIQFGFGRTNPSWYGDESLVYSIILPVLAGLWLYSEYQDRKDIRVPTLR